MSGYLIGVTGPTGAGKSALCDLLKKNSYAVVNADEISKKFIDSSTTCKQKLAVYFGKDILDKENTLQRDVLAKKAFYTKEGLNMLNKITHAGIINEIKNMICTYKLAGHKIIILDAPLLFETGLDAYCDRTVAVLANEEIRRERLLKRDNLAQSLINLRISVQNKNSYYEDKANYVLVNESTFEDLNKKAKEIFSKLLGDTNEKI